MTDHTVADKVYMEPLTIEFLKKISKEHPDALSLLSEDKPD